MLNPHPMALPTRTDSAFRLLEVDANHAKGVAFNMLFMIWRVETKHDAMTRAGRIVLDLHARYPEGVGVLQVVDVGAKPPDAGARAGISEFLKLGAGVIRHSSVVHEGQGFGAAAVRAVMASIHMMHRPQYTHTTFSSLTQASTFHASHQQGLGRRETAETIARQVELLRREM